MSTVIDELVITLGIDGSRAQQGMQQVTSAIEGGVSKIQGALAGAAAAFAGIYSVGAAFSEYVASVDALGKFSDALGVNIEDMHAWSEAAIRSGGSAEGFQGSLKSLTTQLSKMSTTGSSRAGKILASVGIDPGEIGRQRDSFEVLLEIADAMQNMSKAEAMGFGASLGLDTGTIMMLQQGRDGVKDLIRHQKELGVYTKEDAKITADFNDAVADTKQAFMGLAAIVFRMVVPGMKTLINYFTQFISFIRRHQTFVKAFFVMIATLITGLLIPTLKRLFMTMLANPITWVILLIAALALVIEDLIVWMEGGESALDSFWESLFGDRENAKQIFEDIKTAVVSFVEETIPKLKEFGNTLKELWEDAKKSYNEFVDSTAGKILIHMFHQRRREVADYIKDIRNLYKRAKGESIEEEPTPEKNAGGMGGGGGGFDADPIGDFFPNMQRSIEESINGLKDSIFEFVNECCENITNAVTNEIQFVQDTVAEGYEWIKAKVNEALEWIKTKWNEMRNGAVSAIGGIKGAISDLASFIMSKIGSAIDWAIDKFNALKSLVTGTSLNVQYSASAADSVGGRYFNYGGDTTNNSETTYNITMNGVQNGKQAATDFRNGLSAYQGDGGNW